MSLTRFLFISDVSTQTARFIKTHLADTFSRCLQAGVRWLVVKKEQGRNSSDDVALVLEEVSI